MLIENYKKGVDLLGENAYLISLTSLLYLCTVETPELAADTTQDCVGMSTHSLNSLRACAEKRLSIFSDVLSTINQTPSSFIDLYLSMMLGESTLLDYAHKHSFKADPNKDLSAEEKRLCHNVAEQYVKNLNLKPKPDGSAEIYIFAGPTAGGKTEALGNMHNQIAIPNDAIILDLDLIRPLLKVGYVVSNQAHVASTRALSWYTSDLIAKMILEKNYSLVIQSPLHRLERILADSTLTYARNKNIPVHINYVLRPVVDCFLRSLHRERGILVEDLIASMEGINNLPKILDAYPNIKTLNLIDFYPYFRRLQGTLPKLFLESYNSLIEALRSKKGVTIYPKQTNYPILDN